MALFPPLGDLPGSSLYWFLLPVGAPYDSSTPQAFVSPNACGDESVVAGVRSEFQSCLDHSLASDVVKQGGHIIYHLNRETFESELRGDDRCQPDSHGK